MADQEQALMEKLRVEPGETIRLKDRNPRDKSLFGDEQVAALGSRLRRPMRERSGEESG